MPQITSEELASKLEQRLNATVPKVEDLSGGCGQMFSSIVVSDEFIKKTTLARHRLVNNALKEEIAQIHAWNVKCYTNDEWAKELAKGQES